MAGVAGTIADAAAGAARQREGAAGENGKDDVLDASAGRRVGRVQSRICFNVYIVAGCFGKGDCASRLFVGRPSGSQRNSPPSAHSDAPAVVFGRFPGSYHEMQSWIMAITSWQ